MMDELAKRLAFERLQVSTDMHLHVAHGGEGPLVVLLHGFPEFWYSWRFQIPALIDAGFRVAAPDMRGYGKSDRPRGVKAYRHDKLVEDVRGLIEALGEEKAYIVGHDWGAAVAWSFAMQHPDYVEKLAILNVPHHERFQKGLKTRKQLLKSWYIFFFQIPWLPERAFQFKGWRVLRRSLKEDCTRQGAFAEGDLQYYVEALGGDYALTGPINYYRAAARFGLGEWKKILVPTLVIWGEEDRYLGAEMAQPSARWVPDCRVHRIADASHWVMLDAPAEVNTTLIDFFAGPS